jgi:hypothetical protein
MKNFGPFLARFTVAAVGIASAAELKPAATSAWQAYVRTADMRMHARLDAPGRFLWVDEAPGRNARVRNSEILVEPGLADGTQTVPNGLIHHWLAAAFIPSVKLSAVLDVAHDFANYKQFYHPAVVDSKLLGSGPGGQSFSMRSLHKVLFITAVLDDRFVTRDFQVDANRFYIVADATSVQEVEDYGRPTERVLPPDHGRGFIWRLHTLTRYEERDGGVYIEMEAIALSRDIPASLRWVVNPAVNHFSQSELASCLRQTREAVKAVAASARRGNDSLARNSVVAAHGGQQ